MSPHRKTVRHYDAPGEARFLTFSCYQRLPLLAKTRTRLWLVEALNKACQKYQFDLWAWVIMPEHVHLLLNPEPQSRMKSILASIKKPVGYRAIQFLKANAPRFLDRLTVRNKNRTYHRFWQQGPGFDENLDDTEGVQSVVDYIHFNPVRRGLVERPEDWYWSSAMSWAGYHYVGLQIDRTVPMAVGGR